MSNRAKKAQAHAIEAKMEEMLLWYLENSATPPTQLCEDEKTYRGIVLRWLEPVIPGIDNPVLIEEAIGDSWTLRYEFQRKEIKIFT